MASSTMVPGNDSKESSFLPVIIYSCIFHILVFFVVPLATKFLWRKEMFVRPTTFQLVQVPPQPVTEPQKKVAEKSQKKQPAKRARKPVPKKNSKPAPQKQRVEDVSELEDLLGGLPQPVSRISVGESFPYPWYLNNVQMKVEQNWKPPINDESLAVVVEFSIYPNGRISEVRVVKSSGNTMLDNLAVRAVKLAAPFGKIPAGFTMDKLDLTYTLIPAVK